MRKKQSQVSKVKRAKAPEQLAPHVLRRLGLHAPCGPAVGRLDFRPQGKLMRHRGAKNISEPNVPDFRGYIRAWTSHTVEFILELGTFTTRKMYMIHVEESVDRNHLLERNKLEKKAKEDPVDIFLRLLYPHVTIVGYLPEEEDRRQKMELNSLDEEEGGSSTESIGYSSEELAYVKEWYYGFDEKRLRQLFEQYYVQEYNCFCLAVKPGTEEGDPSYRLLLPKYLIQELPQSMEEGPADNLADDYFGAWVDMLRASYGNNYMNKAGFLACIRRIREIAKIYQTNKTIGDDECRKINVLCKGLPKTKDITSDFLYSVSDSLIEDLMQNKVISQCQFCGDFIVHQKNKEYCSLLREEKNCGKRARNKRQYERRKLKTGRPTRNGSHPAEKRT